MMASNILSRFLPPALGTPSVYEMLRQHEESSDQSDPEERAGTAIDEENLGGRFQDHELEEGLFDAAAASQVTEATPAKSRAMSQEPSRRVGQRSKRLQKSQRRDEVDEVDDEVPQSLLIEGDTQTHPLPIDKFHNETTPPPVAGPTTTETRARWQATREQQRLHQDMNSVRPQRRNAARQGQPLAILDPKEMAMWRWANIENLDNFLKDVYDYFLGNGIWCILLSRALNLLWVFPER